MNPLCVVIVLRLRTGPSSQKLRETLDELQLRHVLLRCGIRTDRKPFEFEVMDPIEPIEMNDVHRTGSGHWEDIAEVELNTRFDPSGPLVRLVHLSGDSDESELILVLHHAVMDGISARLLLHEILHLSNDVPLPPPLPEADQVRLHGFPSEYRGSRLVPKLVRFLGRQLWSELTFARKGLGEKPATVPYNRVLHLSLPPDVSRRLNLRIGRAGLSLNSVLNAALLRAVRDVLHLDAGVDPDRHSLMRAIFFANLRPALEPTPDEAVLGCMISMLRVSVPVATGDSLIDIARRLKRGIFASGKSGEPFMAAVMAKTMVQLAFKAKMGRIGNAAVSFLGKLDLQPYYGTTELVDVHAFITNNVVGPELSAFGKVLFGRIELDMTYLASEISVLQARELLSEVEVSLHGLADGT